MKNYKVEVQEVESSILFSHKVVEGTSDHSFGIHVAQMAGLPTIVLQRANELLQRLEQTKAQSDETPSTKNTKKGAKDQLSIFEFKDDELRTKLRSIDLNAMTPIEAFSILQDLIKQANKN
jgi:DNA mismatch repair protein MutS